MRSSFESLIERVKKIVTNLDKYFNIKISFEKLMEDAGGTVGRPHIARAIIKTGYSDDWEYVFNHILSEKSSAYVPNEKISTQEGIKLLKTSGAITVCAHPIWIKNSNPREIIELGVDGIEAYYSEHTEKHTKEALELANKYNLLITCGSDFHKKQDIINKDIGSVYFSEDNLKPFLNLF